MIEISLESSFQASRFSMQITLYNPHLEGYYASSWCTRKLLGHHDEEAGWKSKSALKVDPLEMSRREHHPRGILLIAASFFSEPCQTFKSKPYSTTIECFANSHSNPINDFATRGISIKNGSIKSRKLKSYPTWIL
jgi:hypothetical protein